MNLHTTKEYKNTSKHFLFRLKKLYGIDRQAFYDMQDYLPFPLYINDRETFRPSYMNKDFLSRGDEMHIFLKEGFSYLYEISDLTHLEKAVTIAKTFHKTNDHQDICEYLQIVKLDGKMTPYFTNKIIMDDQFTMNTSLFPLDFSGLDKIFKEMIPFKDRDSKQFILFQTLTKKEKLVFKLISEGYTNKEIADKLYNSPNTVRTHRNRIWKKLEIKHFSDCFRYKAYL